MNPQTPIRDCTWIAFDTETSGKYPLGAEICEIAAVKQTPDGQRTTFESLVQVSRPMGEEVIKIHGITNEMLVGAPTMSEVLPKFLEFVSDGYLVAHHAQFDLGFVGWEMEKRFKPYPTLPVLCSSLLSRRYILESPNHKLQTLIDVLGLHRGAAHRALDDAIACLDLVYKCFDRLPQPHTLQTLFDSQGGGFLWPRFSLKDVKSRASCKGIIEALLEGLQVEIIYGAGANPPKRILDALGIVRNLDGDFFVGREKNDINEKRFYLEKMRGSSAVR